MGESVSPSPDMDARRELVGERVTLRRELWAVLDLDPQTDRDLVETVRNLAGRAADLRAAVARRGIGVFCDAAGHYTAQADLVGSPNDEDWRCSHCARTELERQHAAAVALADELEYEATKSWRTAAEANACQHAAARLRTALGVTSDGQ